MRASRRAGERVVDDRHLDVDRDATHRVDDLLETVEVHLDEVADLEVIELADDRFERVVAAGPIVARPQVGATPVIDEPGIDLLAVGPTPDALRRTGRYRHLLRVARQAEHRDLLGDRVDGDRDQRVGVVAAGLLIGADQQDVQPLPPVPGRDLDARHGCADQRRLGCRRDGGLDAGLVAFRGDRGRARRRVAVIRVALGHEDAAPQGVLGQQVIPGDDHVAAGHHQHDREEAGDRQRVPRHPGAPQPAVA
jgi:hypothetical protein